MDFKDLLRAIEAYVEARRDYDARLLASCSDWDCGLAVEFDTSAASAGREKLEKATADLEEVLNAYIELRIEAVLKGRKS